MLVLQAIGTFTASARGTQIPADLYERLPFVVARRIGGAPADNRFADRATVQVDVWAETRKAASDVASAIRFGFRDAVHNQTVFAAGHFARCDEISAPAELRTSGSVIASSEVIADNVWRFTALYSLVLRPAS